MVIFLFPIVPFIIALLILLLSLFHEIASVVNVITTIGWIVVIGLSIITVFYNLFRKVPTKQKILCSIITIVSTIISMLVSKTFLFGIGSMDTSGVFETIEFGATLIWGGLLWLVCVGLCTYASFNCFFDEYEEPNYGFSIIAIIGSILIGNIFGLL